MASLTWSALTSSTSQVMFCAVTQPSAHPFPASNADTGDCSTLHATLAQAGACSGV